MNRSFLRSYCWTALGSVALAQAFVTAIAPPDPYTQLYYLVPASLLALIVALWLTRGGWGRLGARPTENSAWWFWSSLITVALLGGWLAELFLLDLLNAPTVASAVSAFVVLTAFTVAAWLAYFGGVSVVRRSSNA